jgi:excisionase family DNA binding protein
MEEWITVKEAAKIRNCTERNVLRLIQNRTLEAKKDGHKWLILKESVEHNSEESPNMSEFASVLKAQLEEKDRQIERLQKQLEDKDKILEDASQRHDTIVMQLTRQLEQSQKMLSAHQEPWYRKWFRKSQQSQNR